MQERKRPGEGDISGPTRGDYTDWDNPEDQEWEEAAPEGYYDDEDAALDDGEELDPDDPDYDLSEAAGYADWEPSERSFFLPQWVIVALSILLILALLLPALRWFG
ncbi:MAG: hypothetical protein HYY03_04970 [Chloroflexi bacterium]|nr:hypothetical protein [Chloroflexota bacterium]